MLVTALFPRTLWILKSIAYVVIFRIRTIRITYLSCLLIAGAPMILGFVPLPLPGILVDAAAVALAVYMTMHYTGVSLVPDGLFIPLGVEVVFKLAVWVIGSSILGR